MLETFMFWVNFGLLWLFLFSFIIYHLFSLFDYYIATITDGDYSSFLRDKLRNPLLIKLGVMDKVDSRGNVSETGKYRYMFNKAFVDNAHNRWAAIWLFWLSILGFVGAILLCITSFRVEHSLLECMIRTSTHMNAINTYTLSALILIVLHSTLKTLYKSGKNIKNKLDKLD
tara:strand:- start:586 stop:1101 length:516 start_codon:yes stop_codon:yes gene_type:complete